MLKLCDSFFATVITLAIVVGLKYVSTYLGVETSLDAAILYFVVLNNIEKRAKS